VLVTGQALLLGLGEHLPEELGHDLPLQQSVAVVGEDGRHPDRRYNPKLWMGGMREAAYPSA
jgi:hypothetical protein